MLYVNINVIFVFVGKLFVSARPVHRLRRSRGADGHHAGPQVRGWNAALPDARFRWPPAPEQARSGHETQMRGHTGHGVLEVKGAERAGAPASARPWNAIAGCRRWTGRSRRTGRRLQG